MYNHYLALIVSVLSLQCDTHDHIGLLIGMINVAIADKEKCRLKNLLCTMPDISLHGCK